MRRSLQLFPTQKATFDAKLATSLTSIGTRDSAAAIASGIAWGQTVADAILAWRSTDGFTPAPPPFLGGTGVGQWRPTPPALAPGAGPQFAYMTPWVISSPGAFRPAGPPALTSDRYTADFNETYDDGQRIQHHAHARSDDLCLVLGFEYGQLPLEQCRALAHGSRAVGMPGSAYAAGSSGNRRSATLESARLLALLNLAMADAAIGCWDAKYTYVFWRPVTAIPLADTDGNPATTADPTWAPAVRDAGVPRISVRPFLRQRCGRRRARALLR